MYRFLFVSLFVIVLAPMLTFACSCDISPFLGKSEKQQVKEARKNADAVFVGELIELIEAKKSDTEMGGEVIAKFKIERSWKETSSEEITIFTTNICCICGFSIQKGARYIVYASGKDRLYTTICTRTTPIGVTSEDEKYLGKPIARKKKKVNLVSTFN